MRTTALLLALGLGACAMSAPEAQPSPYPPTLFGFSEAPPRVEVMRLVAADDATRRATGDLVATFHAPAEAPEENDPVNWLTLRFADGASLVFQELNHAPYHVMAQAPGGPLARFFGLSGEARPTLYSRIREQPPNAPAICAGVEWTSLLVYAAPDGAVQIAALRGTGVTVDPVDYPNPRTWPVDDRAACAHLHYRRTG